MIIFINLGHQINNDKSERPQFAFYCTVSDSFHPFNGESTWGSIEDFTYAFNADNADNKNIERYTSKIPETFGKDYSPLRSLVDAFNDVFGDDLIQVDLDKGGAWAEKYNTEKE